MARQTVRELQNRLAPVTLSREQLLTVPEPLLPLFPFGGLQPGLSVGFEGVGSTSVALGLAASVLGNDRWMAVIGVEELGLLAASELGIRLDRLLLIGSTGISQLAPVVAALIEAVDVIALQPRRRVGPRDARRLAARARERGTVLLHLDGGRTWPEALDLRIIATAERWDGLGQGHGHLQQRRLTVASTGRRSSARRRQVSILAPGPDGRLAPAPAPRHRTRVDAPRADSTAASADAAGPADDEALYARAG